MSFFKKDKSASGDSSDLPTQLRKIADHLVFLEKKIDTLLEQSRNRRPFSNNGGGGFNRGFQNRPNGGRNNHGSQNRPNNHQGNGGKPQYGRPHSARDSRFEGGPREGNRENRPYRDGNREHRPHREGNRPGFQNNRSAFSEGNIQPSQEPSAESND